MDYFDILLARNLANKGDITTESLSVTQNGTYTAPQGKAYSPVTVSVQPPESSYQLKSITTPTSLATFEASAMPMPTLKASIKAQQDLHGYDHPWVGGAGKNKLPNPTAEAKTVGNLTVSVDSLGIITVSGSTSETTTILFNLPSNFVIPISVGSGGSGCVYLLNPSVNNNIVLMLYNNDTVVDTWTCSELNRKSSSYTAMGGLTINKIGIRVLGTTTISGSFKLSPMVTNDGTTDATSYEPYSNICPISGWDNAIVTDTDDVDNPTVTQTTTISLGQTVYGGEVDVVNGILKITDGYIASYNGETLPSTWISSMDVYAEGTSPTTGAEVCYELANPIIINLTPSLIKSLNGQNNLSVDCGEIIEGEYFKALGGE